ncbi:unnamed protein product [Arctogadus glacialis]
MWRWLASRENYNSRWEGVKGVGGRIYAVDVGVRVRDGGEGGERLKGDDNHHIHSREGARHNQPPSLPASVSQLVRVKSPPV